MNTNCRAQGSVTGAVNPVDQRADIRRADIETSRHELPQADIKTSRHETSRQRAKAKVR